MNFFKNTHLRLFNNHKITKNQSISHNVYQSVYGLVPHTMTYVMRRLTHDGNHECAAALYQYIHGEPRPLSSQHLFL